MPLSCLIMQDVRMSVYTMVSKCYCYIGAAQSSRFGNSLRASSSSSAACSYPTKALEQHWNSQRKHLGLVLAKTLVRLRVTSSIARQNLCYILLLISVSSFCTLHVSYPPFFRKRPSLPRFPKFHMFASCRGAAFGTSGAAC